MHRNPQNLKSYMIFEVETFSRKSQATFAQAHAITQSENMQNPSVINFNGFARRTN
jgi:hypothetical protein